MRLFIFIFIFFFCSCGAKKVVKSKSSKLHIENRDLVNEVQNDIYINTKMYKLASKLVIEPIDNSKPSYYTSPEGETTKLENAKISIDLSEVKKDSTSFDNSSSTKIDKSKVKTQEESKDVNKDISRFQWWIGIPVLIVIILIFWYRKSLFVKLKNIFSKNAPVF